MTQALAYPEREGALDALHRDAELLAPQSAQKYGQNFDANAKYRESVREVLAKGFTAPGGNGPDITVTEYGVITCSQIYKGFDDNKYHAKRVVADPQDGTKVLDLQFPADSAIKKQYSSK
jgi:hypothetical protein